MNIALIGYGKMGKTIEEIALSRNHTISGKVNRSNRIEDIDFSNTDIAIEFSIPQLAVKHIEYCVSNNTPMVVGTTAWNDQLSFVKDFVLKANGTLLHASNFSVGVNIFAEINQRLAQLMAPQKKYQVCIEEIHHLQKLDAPSGTATSLADEILLNNENLSSWLHQEKTEPKTNSNQFSVVSHRKEGVAGTHSVTYTSDIDTIELTHTAHSRKGFALGAVLAAEWVYNKKGIFTMKDVIKN